jgi:hypothetical protein
MADVSEWSIEASAITAELPLPSGPNIYVDPVNGNDAADWTTPETAAKSLVSVLSNTAAYGPGVTINLMAGEHRDSKNIYWQSAAMAYHVRKSGTAENPIVFQAAPGHEGRAIIVGKAPGSDAPHDHGGFVLEADYVHFKNLVFKHMMSWAILNWNGHAEATPAQWSQQSHRYGIVVDSCIFYDCSDRLGVSIGTQGGVRMDGHDSMIVRNCFDSLHMNSSGGIDRGMMARCFGGRNALIEQCTVHDAIDGAWYQKQWSCNDDNTPVFGVRITRCYINDCSFPTSISQSNGYCSTGDSLIDHNIIVNMKPVVKASEWGGAMCPNMGASQWAPRETVSGSTRFEHNLVCAAQGNGLIMVASSASGVAVRGNIASVGVKAIHHRYEDPTLPHEVLSESDYNLWSGQSFYLGSRTQGAVSYETLAQWQNAKASDHPWLAIDNPDANSIRWGTDPTYAVLYKDFANRDFTYADGSPAIGFMPDGSNAGPYQVGNEVIGCRLPWYDLREFWPDIPDWLNPGKGVT